MEANARKIDNYGYEDLEATPEDEVWELIEGELVKQEAPSDYHEMAVQGINRQLQNYLFEKKYPCRAYTTPYTVFLPNTNGKKNGFVPDIMLICDKENIDKKRKYYGIPYLVVEVHSPGNSKKHESSKYRIYETNGVTEYWRVDPIAKTVQAFRLTPEKKYHLDVEYSEENEKIQVRKFEDLIIDFNEVFDYEVE
jgi:Uma2 family endonuclease